MSDKILLIEDNQTDIELTRRAFQKCLSEQTLEVKEDGQDALDFLASCKNSSNELPKLILLDLKLPKISGLEVLRQIKADTGSRHIPVIVLTSSGEEKDIAAAYDLGANSYIRKPVDFKLFAESLQMLVDYWFKLNLMPPRQNYQ